jgi:hypothetical protein
VSATSGQPLSMTRAWPRPLISTISVTPGLPAAAVPGLAPEIRFAFGTPGAGVAGFRRTHRQAVATHAVALAAGPSGPRLTSFAEVAPLALMSNSVELVRAWVIETLWPLADDDDHQARLRDTLQVFLEENGGDSLASPPEAPTRVRPAAAGGRGVIRRDR